MTVDRPLDYKTTCIRQAARAVKAYWMGYRAMWSALPLTEHASIESHQWLGLIKFNKPVQPHHLHAIALRGCVAELQFRAETPYHPHDDRAVSGFFSDYQFTDLELAMMGPYCSANSIPPHHVLDIKYYTGMWPTILKEAQRGRYRNPRDKSRFEW